MFFLSTPSDDRIHQILSDAAELPFNYAKDAEVGATRAGLEAAPDGFVLDVCATQLGTGQAVYERACALLADFGHYPASFTRVIRSSPMLAPGLVFAPLASHFGFASLHPCRVVYVIRKEPLGDELPKRFGFGLGTLPGHIARGEERFLVTLDARDESVRYEVQAISRPSGLVARLGGIFTRHFQRRFQRETQIEMRTRVRPLNEMSSLRPGASRRSSAAAGPVRTDSLCESRRRPDNERSRRRPVGRLGRGCKVLRGRRESGRVFLVVIVPSFAINRRFGERRSFSAQRARTSKKFRFALTVPFSGVFEGRLRSRGRRVA